MSGIDDKLDGLLSGSSSPTPGPTASSTPPDPVSAAAGWLQKLPQYADQLTPGTLNQQKSDSFVMALLKGVTRFAPQFGQLIGMGLSDLIHGGVRSLSSDAQSEAAGYGGSDFHYYLEGFLPRYTDVPVEDQHIVDRLKAFAGSFERENAPTGVAALASRSSNRRPVTWDLGNMVHHMAGDPVEYFKEDPFGQILNFVLIGNAVGGGLGRLANARLAAEVGALSAAGDAAGAAEAASRLSNLGRAVKYVRDSRLATNAEVAGFDTPAVIRYGSDFADAAAGIRPPIEPGLGARVLDKLAYDYRPVMGVARGRHNISIPGEPRVYLGQTIRNPILRAAFQPAIDRLALENMSGAKQLLLAQREAALAVQNIEEVRRLDSLIASVDRVASAGLTLKQRPWFYNYRAKFLTNHIVGHTTSDFYQQRNIAYKELEAAIDPNLSPESYAASADWVTGKSGQHLLDRVPVADLEPVIRSAGFSAVDDAARAVSADLARRARNHARYGLPDGSTIVGVEKPVPGAVPDPVTGEVATFVERKPAVEAYIEAHPELTPEEMTLIRSEAAPSPEVAALDLTAQASLRKHVADGQVLPFDPLEYQAPLELSRLPERDYLSRQVAASMELSGIPDIPRQTAMFMAAQDMLASLAGSLAAKRGVPFDAAKFYSSLTVRYATEYDPVPNERLSVLTGEFPFEAIAQRLVDNLGTPGGMKAANWYRATEEIRPFMEGKVITLVNGEKRPLFEFTMDFLAGTSAGVDPKDQILAALQLAKWSAEGKLVEKMFQPREVPIVFDDDPAFGDNAGKSLYQGERAGDNINDVREIILGWGQDMWSHEAIHNSLADVESALAAARAGGKSAAAKKLEEKRTLILEQAKKFDVSVGERIPTPWAVTEVRLKDLLAARERRKLPDPVKIQEVVDALENKVLSAELAKLPSIALRYGSRLKERSFAANLKGQHHLHTADRRDMVAKGLVEGKRITSKKGKPSQYESKYGPVPKGLPTEGRMPDTMGIPVAEGGVYLTVTDMSERIVDIANRMLAEMGDRAPLSNIDVDAAQSVAWHDMQAFALISTHRLREWLSTSKAKSYVSEVTGEKFTREQIEGYIRALDLTPKERPTVNYAEGFFDVISDPALRKHFETILNKEYLDKYASSPEAWQSRAQVLAGRVVGRYYYGRQAQQIIEFFQGATAATAPHELGHLIEEFVRENMPAEYQLLTAASMGADSPLFTTEGMQAQIALALQQRGLTTDVFGKKIPLRGYALGRGEVTTKGAVSGKEIPLSMAVDPEQLTPEVLMNYIADRMHLFVAPLDDLGNPSAYWGLWVDENNKWWADVADIFETKPMALEAGGPENRNQRGGWDIVRNEYLPTGGTGGKYGEPKALDPSERTAAFAKAARPDVGVGADGVVSQVGGGDPGEFAPWTNEQREWFADQVSDYWAGKQVNPIVKDLLDTILKDAKDIIPGSSADMSFLYNGLERPYREINLPKGLLTEGDISKVGHALDDAKILPTARAAERPIGQVLREAFGRQFVRSRLKNPRAMQESAELAESGMAGVVDALGYRVILGTWNDVDAALQELKNRFIVHAVEDLRPGVRPTPEQVYFTARDSGYRGVRAVIEDRRYPGLVAEVELGTALFDKTREATATAQRVLKRSRAQAYQLKDLIDSGEVDQLDALETIMQGIERQRLRMTGIWEQLTDELDYDLNGVTRIATPERSTEDALRLYVVKNYEEPLIRAGIDPAMLFDRQYKELRRQSGAKWDDDVMDYVGGKSSIQLALEDAAAGRPQPIYFPEMDLRKHRLTDFLAPSKQRVGMVSSKDTSYLRRNKSVVVSSKGGVWERPEMMRDLRKVNQIRTAKSLRLITELKFAEQIFAAFARPVGSLDEIGASEAPLSMAQIRELTNRQIAFNEEFADALERAESTGLTPTSAEDLFDTKGWPEDKKAELKAIMEGDDVEAKALLEVLARALPKANRKLVGASGSGQLYAIPKVVLHHIQNSSLRSSVWGRLLVDKPNQFWRMAQLGWTPRWTLNNVIGNIFSAKLQGARLSDMVRFIVDKDFQELVQAIAPEGTFGGFFQEQMQLSTKLGLAANTKLGKAYEAMGGSKMIRALGSPARFNIWLNSWAEDAGRAAVFIKAVEREQVKLKLKRIGNRFWTSKKRLERVAIEGLNETTARAALEEVNYLLNDYKTLSPFEKKYVRRLIAPFWSFHKHMARLVITFPFEFPLRALVLKQLMDFSDEMLEEYGPTPSWLDGAVPFGPGKDGKQRYLNTRGPNPTSGLAESPLSLLHPGIKMFLEYFLGRSTFTGREFTDENTVEDFVTRQKFEFKQNPDGTFSVQPVDKVAPNPLELLLQNFVQYNLAKDLIAGANTYDTATLLDVINGRGIIRDRETGEPLSPFDKVQLILRYFGISTTDYDIAKYQTETYPDALNRAVKTYLQRVGKA